jgi:AcrR family transcriptional regulator
MPARPKTSDEQIVQATRELIEREGRDGFSMTDVATAVGIRAPSLHSRFKDRASLISGVEVEVCNEIATAFLDAAVCWTLRSAMPRPQSGGATSPAWRGRSSRGWRPTWSNRKGRWRCCAWSLRPRQARPS